MFNQYDADVLTLGNKMARVMQLPTEVNPRYDEIGKAMCNFSGVFDDMVRLHHLTKHLLIEDTIYNNMLMINFLLGYSEVSTFKSVPIRMEDAGAVCYLKIYKNVDPAKMQGEAFMVSDFAYYCNTFVVLESLESTCEGSGRRLLNQIKVAVKAPILLQAGFLHYGDYEVESRDGVDSGILDRLVEMYVNNGFHIVNSRIGNYEESVAMLHVPKGQQDLLTRILRQEG